VNGDVIETARRPEPAWQSLCLDVLRHARDNPRRPALLYGPAMFSYGDVAGIASAWAGTIRRVAGDRPLVIGIVAGSTPVAYIGSLAAQLAGAVFVPIDPTLPDGVVAERLRDVDAGLVAVDVAAEHVADRVSRAGIPTVIWDERRPVAAAEIDLRRLRHRRAGLIYILFTSGSTGRAKPTPITVAGARSAVIHARAAVALAGTDRIIQTFPVGFDLNILSTYLAWGAGAALVLPTEPGRVENVVRTCSAESCTVWFSVPSLARLVADEASLPAIRASLFCGEPLYGSDVVRWRRIAPHGSVDNLYGPTECAMVATHYRCPEQVDARVQPIGSPFPDVEAVIDTAAREATGELLLGGVQTMPGYWRRPAETRRAMLRRGRERLYRTGDLVTRGPDGQLQFVGRVDDQVKVMGHRIELQEVNLMILAVSGVDEAVAFAVTDATTNCKRLVAVYTSRRGLDPAELHAVLTKRCPSWMVPWPLVRAGELPRNASGKTSVAQLRREFAARALA
jgi:amino acid adenylation domain-containing protein